MKYTFTQFGTLEIEPTSIEINYDSLVQYPNTMSFDVEVKLVTAKVKYSHTFRGLNYVGLLTNGLVGLKVSEALEAFAV